MITTFTKSATDTYTVARASYVMGKVYEDMLGMFLRGLISKERAERDREQLLYLLSKKAVNFFQFQFKDNGKDLGALHYDLKADASISSDHKSGKINYWSLPSTTTVFLLVSIDYSSPNIEEVQKQIKEWGWGYGNALSGTQEYLKSYSMEGYGLKQNKIGAW